MIYGPELADFFDVEWNNQCSMMADAVRGHSQDDMPPPPTLGTAHGSMVQAPDDVVASWCNITVDKVPNVRAELGNLVAVHGENAPLPTRSDGSAPTRGTSPPRAMDHTDRTVAYSGSVYQLLAEIAHERGMTITDTARDITLDAAWRDDELRKGNRFAVIRDGRTYMLDYKHSDRLVPTGRPALHPLRVAPGETPA